MKIAIISPGPFPVPPVKGSSVEHVIDQVSRVLARNHTVLVYSRTSSARPKFSQTGNLRHIRVPFKGSRMYLKRIISDLRRHRVDAVLIENRPSYVTPLRQAFPRLPLVVNMHSIHFASPAVISPKRMRRIVREMDGMITNSRYLRRYYIRRHLVPARRIDAVHLGINSSHYLSASKWRPILRRRLGFHPEHRVLFYAGRLLRQKGVHVLLATFRRIARQDSRARLVIAGGSRYGSNRPNAYVRHLYRLAKPLGGKVKFIPFIPQKQMPRWYQAADLVATPSQWAEAFCRVNLEGMAAGKPVFTTTSGGIPEVVAHRVTGFCVPPSQWPHRVPILWSQLWKNQAQLRRMGQRARHHAARFSWEKTARGYQSALKKAIQHRRMTNTRSS